MKKLLLVLTLLTFSFAYGQDASTLNVNLKEGKIKKDGIISEGLGIYNVRKKGKVYQGKKSLRLQMTSSIQKFVNIKNSNYKILNEDLIGGERKVITITFELRDKQSGNLLLSKKEAIKELKDLKELLDLGILSKTEFDEKALYLKKIILK